MEVGVGYFFSQPKAAKFPFDFQGGRHGGWGWVFFFSQPKAAKFIFLLIRWMKLFFFFLVSLVGVFLLVCLFVCFCLFVFFSKITISPLDFEVGLIFFLR